MQFCVINVIGRRFILGVGAVLLSLQTPVFCESVGSAVPPSASVQAKTQAQRIMERLRNTDGKDVLVAAHRQDHLHFPENSVAAIEGAIKLGVDIVEVDVRKTRDGHLVLMHDETVSRTTTGKGKVSSLTIEKIKMFRLKGPQGEVTSYTVPTLKEVMLATKGHVVVNLDKCHDVFGSVHEVLKQTGTLDQVIFNYHGSLSRMRTAIGPSFDDVVVMPVLELEAKTPDVYLPKPTDERKPSVVQFVFNTPDNPVLQEFRDFRKNGSRVWVNSMWPQLCAGHDDNKAIQDPDAHYGWLVNLGANVIQTDQPEFLIQYLKGKGLHE
jgi:glycerophosphoryl diester phosphodiesterase